MIDIKDIVPGKSYACKFRVETMVDSKGKIPGVPTFDSAPLKGIETYEGLGIIMQRDMEKEVVKLKDHESLYEFVIPFSDIWDIDTVEWSKSPE